MRDGNGISEVGDRSLRFSLGKPPFACLQRSLNLAPRNAACPTGQVTYLFVSTTVQEGVSASSCQRPARHSRAARLAWAGRLGAAVSGRTSFSLPGPSSDRACHPAARPSPGLQASCHHRAIRGPQLPALGRAPGPQVLGRPPPRASTEMASSVPPFRSRGRQVAREVVAAPSAGAGGAGGAADSSVTRKCLQ